MEELEYRPNLMASHLSQSRSFRIGVFLPVPEQDSGYWALPLAGVARAESDVCPLGMEIELIHFDRYDADSYAEAGRRLVDGRFDGVVMAPVRPELTATILEGLGEQTALVFVDTDLPSVPGRVYIGQNSYQSGRLAARLLEMLTGMPRGQPETVLVLMPNTENVHLQERVHGFRDYLRADCRMARINVELDHDHATFARRLAHELDDDVAGLFVADAAAHFVAEVLAQRGEPRPRLVGFDLVTENRRWLQAGVIDALLTQRPTRQGYLGVRSLYRRLFLGQEQPAQLFMPIDIVLAENLPYMNDEEGG